MAPELQIIEGGGWHTRQTIVRPKARLFTLLSVAWLAVVGFGLFLFWSELVNASSWRWLYLLTGLPEPVFIVLAVVFRVTEEPRPINERRGNPDVDPRKLY